MLALSIPFFLSLRFGASRSQGWSGIKRLVYALALPVTTLIHLRTLLVRAARLEDTRHRVAAQSTLAWYRTNGFSV